MFYEVTSIAPLPNNCGEIKDKKERFIIDDCVLFAEAEVKMYSHYNNENNVTAIKQSKIREFVNTRQNEDEDIYIATIEDVFVNDNGEEKTTQYVVGLFAESIDSAAKITKEYMKQGLQDMFLIGIKRTKIVDLL